MIQCLLVFLGILVLLKPLFNLILTLYVHFKPFPDLKKVYGENSWVVVTGGSDGIGFGFCEELAARGFNICIISRSGDKIKEKIT